MSYLSSDRPPALAEFEAVNVKKARERSLRKFPHNADRRRGYRHGFIDGIIEQRSVEMALELRIRDLELDIESLQAAR